MPIFPLFSSWRIHRVPTLCQSLRTYIWTRHNLRPPKCCNLKIYYLWQVIPTSVGWPLICTHLLPFLSSKSNLNNAFWTTPAHTHSASLRSWSSTLYLHYKKLQGQDCVKTGILWSFRKADDIHQGFRLIKITWNRWWLAPQLQESSQDNHIKM